MSVEHVGELRGVTCVVKRGVACRIAEENTSRVVVDNEAHDIGVALLTATHEWCQALRIRHVEGCTKRIQSLESKRASAWVQFAGKLQRYSVQFAGKLQRYSHLDNIQKALPACIMHWHVALLVFHI